MIEATTQPSPPPPPARHGAQTLKAFPSLLLQLAALLLAAAFATAPALAQLGAPRLDVPFVPTPQSLVERMLEIADVKPGELVVDLGCGDGRMVVTAASKFGARGLGVDLDPVRINEAKGNARKAGVTDRVEFRTGDLFEVDISEADVLAIYLLSEINLRLRPKILSTMKPGSRVVSHAFNMGDWQPDHHENVDGRNVYFWIVPARVAGRWQIRQGDRVIDLQLEQSFQEVAGNAMVDGRSVPVREGRLNGSEITFVIGTPDGERRTYRGRIEGDRIEAMGGDGTPAWQASRTI